jgi:hypothetical protein
MTVNQQTGPAPDLGIDSATESRDLTPGSARPRAAAMEEAGGPIRRVDSLRPEPGKVQRSLTRLRELYPKASTRQVRGVRLRGNCPVYRSAFL